MVVPLENHVRQFFRVVRSDTQQSLIVRANGGNEDQARRRAVESWVNLYWKESGYRNGAGREAERILSQVTFTVTQLGLDESVTLVRNGFQHTFLVRDLVAADKFNYHKANPEVPNDEV